MLNLNYWTVVQTEAQREHFARMGIMRLNLETYAPRIRLRSNRVALLFPTYVFVKLTDRWYPVRWTQGVLRVMMAGDQPARLPEKIISTIRSREVGGFVRLPSLRTTLRKGEPVKITTGNFAGQLGIFDGMTSRERSRVLLQLLGQWVPVELPGNAITPLKLAK